jgi:hypothetical protein
LLLDLGGAHKKMEIGKSGTSYPFFADLPQPCGAVG